VAGITTTVAALQQAVGDTSNLTALESSMKQYVDTKLGTANTTIGNTYVKMSDLGDIFDWMWSGLKSSVNDEYSFADVLAAAKNESGHKAIADLNTAIKAEGDKYVAKTSLTASVDSAIAGIASDTNGTYSTTTIFNKVDTNSDNIAAIMSGITGDSSTTNIVNRINAWKTGLLTEATLDSAIATLLATNGTTTSGLMLKSTWDAAQSDLITTNNISNYTSGFVTTSDLNSAKAELVAKNDFTGANIATMVNQAGSAAMINADNITLNALHKLHLTTDNCTIDSQLVEVSGSIYAGELHTTPSSSSVTSSDYFSYAHIDAENDKLTINTDNPNIAVELQPHHLKVSN